MTFDPNFHSNVNIGGTIREYKHAANKEKVKTYAFKMKRCNISEFGEKGQIYGSLIDYTSNFLCIDFDSITNQEGKLETKMPIIDGNIAELEGTSFEINLKNSNLFYSPNYEQVTNNSQYFVNVRFLETSLNLSDYDQPINYKQEIKNIIVSTNMYVRQNLTFKLNELVSQVGWISDQSETISFISLHEKYQDHSSYSETSRSILSIYCNTVREKVVIRRKYLGIPELLANIGGFLKAIEFVMKLIASYYSEYEFYEEMQNIIKKKKDEIRPHCNLSNRQVSNTEISVNEIDSQNSALVPKYSTAYYIFRWACLTWRWRLADGHEYR